MLAQGNRAMPQLLWYDSLRMCSGHSRSSKVVDFSINFPPLINSNVRRILHGFRNTAGFLLQRATTAIFRPILLYCQYRIRHSDKGTKIFKHRYCSVVCPSVCLCVCQTHSCNCSVLKLSDEFRCHWQGPRLHYDNRDLAFKSPVKRCTANCEMVAGNNF